MKPLIGVTPDLKPESVLGVRNQYLQDRKSVV